MYGFYYLEPNVIRNFQPGPATYQKGKVPFSGNGYNIFANIVITFNFWFELKNNIFSHLSNNRNSRKWLSERVILAPKMRDTIRLTMN